MTTTAHSIPDPGDSVLRSALDALDEGLLLLDSDDRVVMFNAAFLALYPHLEAEIEAGMAFGELFELDIAGNRWDETPEKADSWKARRLSAHGEADVTLDEYQFEGRWIRICDRATADGGRIVHYRDITEQVAAENALRASEERYALAAAGANDGLWDWDLTTNRVFFSSRWKEMLGFAGDDLGDREQEWLSRIHPKDVQRVTAQIDAHLHGTVDSFESEHRIRHRDDTYRWMLLRGLAVRDEGGKAYRIAGSMTDVTDRKRAEEQSLHDALHDNLTGLANRTLFLERVRQVLDRRHRTDDVRFAVIYLDIDRFKVVNESLGHAQGDDLIISISRRLRDNLKFGDTVARLGGDEFAMLLEDVADKSEALAVCDMVQKALASPFTLNGKEIFTTASMGAAHSSEGYDRPEDILRDAELAMYRAKELGKARAQVFDAGLRGHTVTPLEMESDLRRALERDEMQLHFQPIISLESGRIQGFEALTRWQHPAHDDVPPIQFIPLAEETGMIFQLGEWVLRQACEQTVAWTRSHPNAGPLEISINLSGRQFSQFDFVRMVTNSLEGTGLPPGSLKLEITESALMENAHLSAQMLQDLKELGIQICVDDFGTGYSSLSYLHTFPIDTLKIDKSFVHDMGRNRHNLEIVRTIALLAQNLKLDVVAEGVETPEQLAQLRAIGCEFAQGFLFSPPLARDGVEALLRENRSW